MTTPTNPIERLTAGRAAEALHLIDPLDHAFERLAVEHPEACTPPTAVDPAWAAWLAVQIAKSDSTRTRTERTCGGAS